MAEQQSGLGLVPEWLGDLGPRVAGEKRRKVCGKGDQLQNLITHCKFSQSSGDLEFNGGL